MVINTTVPSFLNRTRAKIYDLAKTPPFPFPFRRTPFLFGEVGEMISHRCKSRQAEFSNAFFSQFLAHLIIFAFFVQQNCPLNSSQRKLCLKQAATFGRWGKRKTLHVVIKIRDENFNALMSIWESNVGNNSKVDKHRRFGGFQKMDKMCRNLHEFCRQNKTEQRTTSIDR